MSDGTGHHVLEVQRGVVMGLPHRPVQRYGRHAGRHPLSGPFRRVARCAASGRGRAMVRQLRTDFWSRGCSAPRLGAVLMMRTPRAAYGESDGGCSASENSCEDGL